MRLIALTIAVLLISGCGESASVPENTPAKNAEGQRIIEEGQKQLRDSDEKYRNYGKPSSPADSSPKT